MTKSNGRSPRVLIVYQNLPHYRLGVFEALQKTPHMHVEFAAGTSNVDGSIRSIAPTRIRKFHPLENVWIGRFLWQRRLIRLIVTQRWDTIVFLGDMSYISTWLTAWIARRVMRRRVFFWTIGWHKMEHGVKRLIRLRFYNMADGLLLYGSQAKDWGRTIGYPVDRMHVIGNSYGAEESEDISECSALDQLPPVGSLTVGTIIRMNPSKRLEMLIDAAAIARDVLGQEVRVIIGGDGPAKESLRERARTLSVPLHLLGPIYSKESISAFYSRCLVTAIPTRAGLSVLQSLHYGRPVITHNNPEEQMPEAEAIIPGVTGDTYRYGDTCDFGKKVADWLQRACRDEREIADACREVVSGHWSVEHQARSILQVVASS